MYVHRHQGRGRIAYQCPNARHLPACGPYGHQIEAGPLDAAVWSAVHRLLRDPRRVVETLRERQAEAPDDTAAEMASLDAALLAVSKRETNITSAIEAIGDNADAPSGLVTRLGALSEERAVIAARRAEVAGRAAAREAAVDRLADFEGWCGEVLANLDTLDYGSKRDALDRLGIVVYVARRDHAGGGSRWVMLTGDEVHGSGVPDGISPYPATVFTTR